jgi:hypothetical protein
MVAQTPALLLMNINKLRCMTQRAWPAVAGSGMTRRIGQCKRHQVRLKAEMMERAPSDTKDVGKMVIFARQKLTCKLRPALLPGGRTFSGAMSMLLMRLMFATHGKKPKPALFCHSSRSWYSPVKLSGVADMAADRLVSRTGAFPVEIGLLQGVLPSAELLPMLKVRLGTWSMPTTKPSARMGKAIMMVL